MATKSRTGATRDKKFHELLNGVYEAILITDLHGYIETVNSRGMELFGFDGDNLPKKTVFDIISGFTEDILHNVIHSLKDQKHILVEASGIRPDGSTFSVEIAVHKIHLTPSAQLCFSIRDVSARTQAEDRLEEAQEELIRAEKINARLETITTLAHEINNPLQMLLSMIEADRNVRYAAPLNRIIAVLQELRLQEELKSVRYAGGATRYEIPGSGIEWSNPRHVLIVDDEITIRRLFQDVLAAKLPGLHIDTAANGQEGVSLFRARHHAMIILDIAMPIMDGEEAFRHIKKVSRENNWEVPSVIFCTGYTPPESVRHAIETESIHCLVPKPVTSDALVNAVRNRLEFWDLCHGKT